MKTKIQALLQQLNQGLIEREHAIKLALLTTLAGENMVLVGPPGTGKSLVARRVAQSLLAAGSEGGGDYFEYLLTKFSTPEELFGPLSISALKADRFHRNTEGYLPTVRMAFLDEIFKASSSILNALLTILNERVYHNGTQVQQVPLQALIAASNELPTDQQELGALYDRFLVRVFVDYVGAHNLPRLFEPTTEPELRAADRLGATELAQIRRAAAAVIFEPALIQAVQDIWAAHKEAFKEDRRESLSDRRLKKIIHLLRVSAATNGRPAVDLSDLMLLKNCLWNHPDNAAKVQELVLNTLRRHSRQVPVDEVFELDADGKNLVPVRSTSLVPNPTPPARTGGLLSAVSMTLASIQAGSTAAKPGAVVKGYAGSGTADDPLLIKSVDDLMDLARPEVGQRGYHFQQTTDLDISGISTWPTIDFKGNYDGRNHSITDNAPGKYEHHRWLFKSIDNSHVSNLNMDQCGFSKTVTNQCNLTSCKTSVSLVGDLTGSNISQCDAGFSIAENDAISSNIKYCLSGRDMLGESANNCNITSSTSRGKIIDGMAENCKIFACKSTKSIIGVHAMQSEIENCQSDSSIIEGSASDVSIKNCISIIKGATLVRGLFSMSASEKFHGVAESMHDTTVYCCLTVIDRIALGNSPCIVFSAYSGVIENCAIFPSGTTDKFDAKIIQDGEDSDAKLKNNIISDTTTKKYHKGDPVSAARFNQRLLEMSLGWDFDQAWIWDDKEKRPALRNVGVQTGTAAVTNPVRPQPAKGANPSVDLLTQQVKANIWL